MHSDVTEKYIPTIVFILILLLFGFLIFPLIGSILTSIVLAILFRPLYNFLRKYLKSKSLSAFLVCIFVILVFLIPLVGVSQALFFEIADNLNADSAEGLYQSSKDVIKSVIDKIPYLNSEDMDVTFILDRIISFVANLFEETITTLSSKILYVFLSFFLFFYLLMDGVSASKHFFSFFFITENQKRFLQKRFKEVTRGVVFGQILTALTQGAVATLGYYIFGVKVPFVMGLITTFFAFLPIMGTSLVWIPLSLLFFLKGDLFNGFGLLIYGFAVIGIIDNILRPKLIGDRAQLHPALVLIGVISGVHLFGLAGLFIGPLLIVVCIEFSNLYLHKNDELLKRAYVKPAKRISDEIIDKAIKKHRESKVKSRFGRKSRK